MGEIAFRVSSPKPVIPPLIQSSLQTNFKFNTPSATFQLKILAIPCFSHRFPKSIRTTIAAASSGYRIPEILPARDTFLNFGRYRGRMMGTVPQSYLQWMSSCLRAGDMLPWALLADEVLKDPIYKDRIEWETAQEILNGGAARPFKAPHGGSAVAGLHEIGDRFGWDLEDMYGWSTIDFDLLGTSSGGSIPRKINSNGNGNGKVAKVDNLKSDEKVEGEDLERRRERRERQKQLRKVESSKVRFLREGINDGDDEEEESRYEYGAGKRRSSSGHGYSAGKGRSSSRHGSPFPGRESLLNKVLKRGKKTW